MVTNSLWYPFLPSSRRLTMPVRLMMTLSWDVTLRQYVIRYRRFGATCVLLGRRTVNCLQGVQHFFYIAQCTVSVKPHLIQKKYCAAPPCSNQTVNNTVQCTSYQVSCLLGWPYSEGTWLYCDYFIWGVSCTVVVWTGFVMCGCVCVCFSNICTCIYYVFVLFVLCFFIV
jgi:hypothetical protein